MIQEIDALVNTEIKLLLIASLFTIAFIVIIITYIDCCFLIYFAFLFEENTQMDVTAVRDLERFFCETDCNMILIDSPLLMAYEDEQEIFFVGFLRLCITVMHS